MNLNASKSTASFRRQMFVVLRTYLTQRHFRNIILPGMISWAFISTLTLLTTFGPPDRLHGPDADRTERVSSYLVAVLIPTMILGPWLGLHLKQQFADPRSRLLPGFAKAHLATAACLIVILTSLPLLGILRHGWEALATALAIQLAACAWCLWMIQLNSGTMMFLPIAVYFGATYGASPATQTVLAEMILPPSLTVSSIMLLGAGVVGLTGYAMRLATLHEGMREYGIVVTQEMVWNVSSRSNNRVWQQMQGRAVSKSAFLWWAFDRQFAFPMRRLPKHWLIRSVVLLQISRNFASYWIIPLTPAVFFAGAVSPSFVSGNTSAASIVIPFLISVMVIVSLMTVIMQWFQHWRWYSTELLRPLPRNRFIAAIFTAFAVDGAVTLALLLLFLAGAVSQGWTIPGFSNLENSLLCSTHIVAHFATSFSLSVWLLSSRKTRSLIVALPASAITHGILTALSIGLGPELFGVTLPSVLVGSVGFSTLVMVLAWQEWNSIEFA